MASNGFILIRGELVQQTAASFGGNGESDWVDHVLCRDGLGRYTLRGESLAGALAATARRLFKDVPKQIGDVSLKKPSAWRTFTSHPIAPGNTTVRQNVRIHPETGAAANGALFDAETLPPGTRWPFVLEIDLARCGGDASAVLAVTLHALKKWTDGYCWLGRSVARGTGWFSLKNVAVAEVGWDMWPNSQLNDVAEFFDSTLKAQSQPLNAFMAGANLAVPNGDWQWCEYRITLAVAAPKNDDDNYGMDFLAVGGHSGDALQLDVQDDLIAGGHLLLPATPLDANTTRHWIADQVFAYTRSNDVVKPYIPGASLRGVLRHTAEWWAHSQHLSAGVLKALSDLFGDMKDNPSADVVKALSDLFGNMKGKPSADVLKALSDLFGDMKDNPSTDVLKALSDLFSNMKDTPSADVLKALSDLFGAMKDTPSADVLKALSDLFGAMKDNPSADVVKELSDLFGDMKGKPKAGALLVSDGHLSSDDFKAVLLKMHAEDEFAGGVYESALFDRLALVEAQFGARFVIEAKRQDMAALQKALEPAFTLARQGYIGLGGLAGRGFGHLRWQIEQLEGE